MKHGLKLTILRDYHIMKYYKTNDKLDKGKSVIYTNPVYVNQCLCRI